MIAWVAALRLEAGESGELNFDIDPNLKLVA